jgi:hypothetical protein
MSLTTVRQRPCCARASTRVTIEEANLARLAKMAAVRVEKGYSTLRVKQQIEDSKGVIAEAKRRLVDHEASHAGEGA